MCFARGALTTKDTNTEYWPLNTSPKVCQSNDDKIIGGLLHLFQWNPAGMILLYGYPERGPEWGRAANRSLVTTIRKEHNYKSDSTTAFGRPVDDSSRRVL